MMYMKEASSKPSGIMTTIISYRLLCARLYAGNPHEGCDGSSMIPILQMRKLRLREK